MPFCLSVMEDGNNSIVTGLACTHLALAAKSVAMSVLACVVDAKIRQVFLSLSTHGFVHEAVTARGLGTEAPDNRKPCGAEIHRSQLTGASFVTR